MSGSSGDMPKVGAGALPRWEELACDAALFGLGDEERAELDALGADAGDLLALELAAGEAAARAYAAFGEEALPATLAERVLADMEREVGQSVPHDVRQSVPHDVRQSVPHDVRQSLSRDGEQSLSRAEEGDARRPAIDPARSDSKGPAPVIPLRTKGDQEAGPQREDVRSPAWRRVRDAAPWVLAAAAIALAIFGRRGRVEGPVAGPAPAPTVTASADAAPETPASAREALIAIPGTQQLAWKATEDPSAKGANGDVVWHNGAQRGFMRFRGLAANDPAKVQYQLWIFDGERDDKYPVDGGVFNVGPDGEVIVPVAAKLHVNKPTLFAVTVEKPGGVVVSKRERIVLTAAPPPT